MKQDNPEGRLSRWSRRKQQSAEQTLKEDLALLPAENQVDNELTEVVTQSETDDMVNQEPELTDADMPAIESLNEDSNFGQFMSPGVSDQLRNLALRKMYQEPFFNIRDGLDEYDGDYTSFEKLGDIVTADMRHQMEVEARKKLEQETKISELAESDTLEPDEDIDEQQNLEIEAETQVPEDDNLLVEEQQYERDSEIPSESIPLKQ